MSESPPTLTTKKPLAEWLVPHPSHDLSDWFVNLERTKIRQCNRCRGHELEHPIRGHGISDALLGVCTG